MLVCVESICTARGGEYALPMFGFEQRNSGVFCMCVCVLFLDLGPMLVIRISCMEQEMLSKHTCLLYSLKLPSEFVGKKKHPAESHLLNVLQRAFIASVAGSFTQ